MGTAVNPFLDQRIVERVRAEFLEMPDMKLTIEQLQRLCGIEAAMCRAVMDSLVKITFVRLRSDGRYVRFDEGHFPAPQQARAGLKHTPFASPSLRAS